MSDSVVITIRNQNRVRTLTIYMDPPANDPSTAPTAQKVPPSGEGSTASSSKVPPPRGEGSTASPSKVPPPKREGSTASPSKDPPPKGEGSTASPSKVPPPRREDPSASNTHFRKMVYKLDQMEETKNDKKTGKETSRVQKDGFTPNTVLFLFFVHSIAMFCLPFISYFLAKDIAETQYDISTSSSYLYGALASVTSVQLIIVSYVFIAFFEQSRDLPRKQKAA